MPLVYGELRRLAKAHLRWERRDHTLQPTALVHEAYMRMVDQSKADCHSRAHFFGIAARSMRQILVNHAERHYAAKRGGRYMVTLNEPVVSAKQESVVDLLALHQALDKLASLDERQCRIVEMRFFCGLTEEEIADVLTVSSRTVKRDWLVARAWLHGELRKAEQ